jgi:hypothetical protein
MGGSEVGNPRGKSRASTRGDFFAAFLRHISRPEQPGYLFVSEKTT